jgi:hypothetical protein
MFPKSLSYDYRGQRSSALVITLAAVVLISAIILVFFGQSTLHRQMSYTSAGQYRADLVAHTALDTIVGDLRNEITAGSTVTTASGTNIYVPNANNAVVPSQVVHNSSFPNLVKQSISGQPFWPAATYNNNTPGPIRSANPNSTATASWNGRSISLAEWNRPGLLGDRGPLTTPAIPAAPSYSPPDWVIVTRKGPVANSVGANPGPATASGTLADKSPGNMFYVVGRYAYTIYDEGGLLDVNVAGIPSSATPNFSAKRGLLAQVDLGNLLSNPVINDLNASSDANALVKWRNASTYSTISPATLYTNYVLGNINGFTTIANGDQTFVSRQDLIKYTLPPSSGFPTSALQYLGTFSRELNAPSWSPLTPTGSSIDYAGQKDSTTSANRNVLGVRVITSFTRADGTTAQAGEPLIKYRFPLSRLALFGNSNSAIDNGNGSIYTYFGLTRSSASVPWVYNHGTAPNGDGGGKSILLLSDVAALGREPDFFELLQAGILAGSLGQTATNLYASSTNINNDANTFLQVLQIGANLIDQYDTDSFPTRITLSVNGLATEVDGIENLPYLVSVYATPYQIPPPTGSPAGTAGTIGVWFQPEVWNPHGLPSVLSPPSPPNNQSPFRFVASGTVQTTFSPNSPTPTTFTFSTPPEIDFPTVASTFSEPTLVSSPTISPTASGFQGLAALGTPISDPAAPNSYTSVTLTPTSPLTFQLQYWDGAQWVTYSQMRSVTTALTLTMTDSSGFFSTYSPQVCITRSDPRTDRFGVVTSSTTPPNTTLWPTPPATIYATSTPPATIYATSGYTTSTISGRTTTWSGAGSVGTLSDNKTSSSTYYTDPDRIERPADGAYSDGTAAADGGYPLATDSFNSVSSRPYILNRPFQAVAEMGYAFRDEPWKHLDFFTAGSADAALLDLFCLNESPYPSNPTVTLFPSAIPEAGRVNLNTRQATVLQAVLQGAIMAEDDSATLAATEAKNLASNLTSMTSTSATPLPLLNRSELVTRWISAVPTATFDSTSDAIIKRRREAAVRALADVGNTRTWNLLIDVIAQSGRYAPTATTYDQFIVEGERRYWLHVAIDRYTNEVVAQYLEPVYE